MASEMFRVFWQPGCSSCVKVKEFLTQLGVPFESVNVLDDENSAADLAALGAQSIPVVSRGNVFVFAQSLPQVAEFVGRSAPVAERLSAAELMTRWRYFLDVSRLQITQMPLEHLSYRPVPNRDRSLLSLGYHIFQVPHSFLESVIDGIEDWTIRANLPLPANVTLPAHVVSYADEIISRLAGWWSRLSDKDCKWNVKTYYGARPAVELLERQTWHSAQHARQVQSVLQMLNVPLKATIEDKHYRGLPMPTGLWE